MSLLQVLGMLHFKDSHSLSDKILPQVVFSQACYLRREILYRHYNLKLEGAGRGGVILVCYEKIKFIFDYPVSNQLASTCIFRKEVFVLFNDAFNTFYLRLYGVRYMGKDH